MKLRNRISSQCAEKEVIKIIMKSVKCKNVVSVFFVQPVVHGTGCMYFLCSLWFMELAACISQWRTAFVCCFNLTFWHLSFTIKF